MCSFLREMFSMSAEVITRPIWPTTHVLGRLLPLQTTSYITNTVVQRYYLDFRGFRYDILRILLSSRQFRIITGPFQRGRPATWSGPLLKKVPESFLAILLNLKILIRLRVIGARNIVYVRKCTSEGAWLFIRPTSKGVENLKLELFCLKGLRLARPLA